MNINNSDFCYVRLRQQTLSLGRDDLRQHNSFKNFCNQTGNHSPHPFFIVFVFILPLFLPLLKKIYFFGWSLNPLNPPLKYALEPYGNRCTSTDVF